MAASAVRSAGRRAEAWAGLVLTSPALLVFTVFMFAPIALTFWYSLHRYSGFGRMRWLGLDNYRTIAADPTFWTALRNTVAFTAVKLAPGQRKLARLHSLPVASSAPAMWM